VLLRNIDKMSRDNTAPYCKGPQCKYFHKILSIVLPSSSRSSKWLFSPPKYNCAVISLFSIRAACSSHRILQHFSVLTQLCVFCVKTRRFNYVTYCSSYFSFRSFRFWEASSHL
jgi:hypothetical protein